MLAIHFSHRISLGGFPLAPSHNPEKNGVYLYGTIIQLEFPHFRLVTHSISARIILKGSSAILSL